MKAGVRTGFGLLTALVCAIAAATGGTTAGASPSASIAKAKHSVLDSWGGTQERWPGVRTVVLETSEGGKKGKRGKSSRFPVAIDRWGIELTSAVKDANGDAVSTPAFSCDDGSGAGASVPRQLAQSNSGMISFTVDLPFMRSLRVRKHRFSQHDGPYDIKLQNGVIHQSHTVRGRFRTPNRVSGTVVVDQIVETYQEADDGSLVKHVANCHSGPIQWSACRGDLDPDARFKACLGIEQEAWLSPTGQAEPL